MTMRYIAFVALSPCAFLRLNPDARREFAA